MSFFLFFFFFFFVGRFLIPIFYFIIFSFSLFVSYFSIYRYFPSLGLYCQNWGSRLFCWLCIVSYACMRSLLLGSMYGFWVILGDFG